MMGETSTSSRVRRTVAVVVLALVAVVAAGAQGGADGDIARLLAQAAIRPVEPPSAALVFDLPVLAADGALSGATESLANYHGEWVLLTFFATWCTPCRSELPTLVELQDALGERGVSFLTISIDSDLAALARYLSETPLGLLVLWDERGLASRQYLAQSIPLSYLIDPAGRIVGVSRGARNWSALEELFGELLRLRPPDPTQPVAYREGEGPVSLPLRITPPTATVHLAEPRPKVREPFSLDVEIHWAGNFDEYLLHPPQLVLPEGVEQRGVSAETGGEKGRSVVTYSIALEASEPGAFALDPVELRYTPRFESSPVSTRIEGPTVEVLPRTIAGLEMGTFAGVVGGLALAVAGGLVFARRRRRRAVTSDEGPVRRWRQTLEEARRLRLEGELGASTERLLRLELDILGETPEAPRRAELEERLERLRFGGERPGAEEVDRLLRRLEREVEERLAPGEEESRKKRIRLRESGSGDDPDRRRRSDPSLMNQGEASIHDRSS